MGALLYKPLSTTCEFLEPVSAGVHNATIAEGLSTRSLEVCHGFNDTSDGNHVLINSSYQVETTGVVKDVAIIDSTGAGDAFIGGYLVAHLFGNHKFALDFAYWVAGQKLTGPGARSALPWGTQVDRILGTDIETMQQKLRLCLTSFNSEDGLALTLTRSSGDNCNDKS